MSVELGMAELIQRAMESRTADIITGLPCKVKEYFPGADPTADLIPVVKRTLPTDNESFVSEALPVIPNVPILFPRGGGGAYAITWPLQPGDHVWIVVSVYAFSQWRNSGEVSEPGDQRLHSLGNCYAIPGVALKSDDLSQSNIVAMVLEAPEIRLGKNASDFAALASKVEKNFDDIAATLITGLAGANAVTFGSAYSKTPVAATKTKVE
jgi:hypothetical protein